MGGTLGFLVKTDLIFVRFQRKCARHNASKDWRWRNALPAKEEEQGQDEGEGAEAEAEAEKQG